MHLSNSINTQALQQKSEKEVKGNALVGLTPGVDFIKIRVRLFCQLRMRGFFQHTVIGKQLANLAKSVPL